MSGEEVCSADCSWSVADNRVSADMHRRADRVARTALTPLCSETLNAVLSCKPLKVPETWNRNSHQCWSECSRYLARFDIKQPNQPGDMTMKLATIVLAGC